MYYEDKIVLGKSDIYTSNYEYLIFAKKTIVEVIIPPSVQFISPFAFSNYKSLKKVIFPEDSQLQIIHRYAFSDSSIESLTIPSSAAEFQQGWCSSCPYLNEFLIIENEMKNITYSSDKEDEQFVIMNSNASNDDYDILLFAKRNIVRVKIPSFITFGEGSKLEAIANQAFLESVIETITIPPHVKAVCKFAFDECECLKSIKFCENSKLETIEDNAFYNSKLKSLTLPSNVIGFDKYWCSHLKFLNEVKVSKNENEFITFDGDFLYGKSDTKSDNFDVILFARRNIRCAVIPSHVKRIAPLAFNLCHSLVSVDFHDDSKLEIIDDKSFSESSIRSLAVPPRVKKFGNDALSCCLELKIIQISAKSEFDIIDIKIFGETSVEIIMIPHNSG